MYHVNVSMLPLSVKTSLYADSTPSVMTTVNVFPSLNKKMIC